MDTRCRTLDEVSGRAQHHSGNSACENRTGTERAKKKRDLRRNGCLMETETVRCIVCSPIYDTHTEFHASVFPIFYVRNVYVPRSSIQKQSPPCVLHPLCSFMSH